MRGAARFPSGLHIHLIIVMTKKITAWVSITYFDVMVLKLTNSLRLYLHL